MTDIFVNYRTDDSAHAAMAISDRLAHHFGRAHVFRDRDSLSLGTIYPRRIRRALDRSTIVLAVIGARWLDAQDARGRRRIDNPRDWVRTELRMAFERAIPVVPVLVDNAPLPAQSQLPHDIRLLSLSTCHHVRHESFTADVRDLIEKLGGSPAESPRATFEQINRTTGGGVINATQNGNQHINHNGTHR